MKLTRDDLSIRITDHDVVLYLQGEEHFRCTHAEWRWLCSVTPQQKENNNG